MKMVHAKIKAPKKEMLIFNDLSHLFLVEDTKKVTPTILKTFEKYITKVQV